MTGNVQNWYTDPSSLPLYGWRINDSAEGGDTTRLGRFDSSEGSRAPQLVIVYNRPPAAPTLASSANLQR